MTRFLLSAQAAVLCIVATLCLGAIGLVGPKPPGVLWTSANLVLIAWSIVGLAFSLFMGDE